MHRLLILFLLTSPLLSSSQTTKNKLFSFGGYGRVGFGLSPEIQGSVGRSFNLNGMGSIGGRNEEVDYLEPALAIHWRPNIQEDTITQINFQLRLAFFNSGGNPLFAATDTRSQFGGLTIRIPEAYVEAVRIGGSHWSTWVGARFYRGNDIHMADHFFFDDHSAQGFGVKYKNTEFAMMIAGAIDTNSTVPPNFFIQIKNGQTRTELRERLMFILEHVWDLDPIHQLKFLGEYHLLVGPPELVVDSNLISLPNDYGLVLGLKHVMELTRFREGSFNQFSIRYGNRIANGKDGGSSKTWETYGAPDPETAKFTNAFTMALVEHFLFNFNPKFSLNGYGIFTRSRGGSDEPNQAPTYFDRKIFNQKWEFGTGLRSFWYLHRLFHLVGEAHYTLRKDGTQNPAELVKFSIIPTLVPTGGRNPWVRPHIRFIYTLGIYNDFAVDNLYSPFLQAAGPKKIGHYFGFRAEWWAW